MRARGRESKVSPRVTVPAAIESGAHQGCRSRVLEPLSNLVAHAGHGVVIDARVNDEVLVAQEEGNVVRLA